MPTFSDIKWIVIGVVILILTVILIWGGIALHNRASTITDLNSKLDTANLNLRNAAKTANDNAAAVKQLGQQLLQNQEALRRKNVQDVKLATEIANLKNGVSNAKVALCVPPAIVAMVDGLRHLQAGSASSQPDSSPEAPNSSGVAVPAATAPGPADQLIARWVGDLYMHDTTCMNNLQQISDLQAAAGK